MRDFVYSRFWAMNCMFYQMNGKMFLHQKKSSFGQKGKLWLEPLRDWLESLSNAESLITQPDFTEIKSFLEKIGTNRFLQDKKVSMDFVAPYSLVNKYKGLAGEGKLEGIKNKKGDEVKNTTSPVWWNY
jgi:hypothetical protein